MGEIAKRCAYLTSMAVALVREGDMLAASTNWRRGMAPSCWAQAGRYYRAAMECQGLLEQWEHVRVDMGKATNG